MKARVFPFGGDVRGRRPTKAAIKRCFGGDGLGWVVLFPVAGPRRWDLLMVEMTQFTVAVGVVDELLKATRDRASVAEHYVRAEQYLMAHDQLALAGGRIQ